MSAMIASCVFVLLVLGIPSYGLYRGLDVMKLFKHGACDGMQVLYNMLPFILGLYTAIRMLRASGFFEMAANLLHPVFAMMSVPIELLPLILMRPFSGAASNAILVDILKEYGGDSVFGLMAATIMGSTETTFYIISFYFASVAIKKIRYALWTSLLADLVGMLVAIYIVPLVI